MREKFFLIILLFITLSLSFPIETRELSIQQLEERKKADEERKRQEKSVEKRLFKKKLVLQQI